MPSSCVSFYTDQETTSGNKEDTGGHKLIVYFKDFP